MPVTLDQPLAWETAAGDDRAMLEALQPNILKAHARDCMTLLFLRFGDPKAAREMLCELARPKLGKPLIKSAMLHLQEIKAFKQKRTPGTPYVGVGLTASGYSGLGIGIEKIPADPSFRAGMKEAELGDPPAGEWEEPFTGAIDAVILVGDAMSSGHDRALAAVRQLIGRFPGVKVVGEQTGKALISGNKEGIEHFGYVDGRSQPIFLQEDLTEERLHRDGTSNWDPGFGPGRAIVPDPAAPDSSRHFGSYFIYRKLEQNVRLFKSEEAALATRLGLSGDDAERAGAMVVGRFEDGTPVTMQFSEGSRSPVPNNFNYDSDPDGGKCPFFAHIRKLNPRGTGGFEPAEAERLHLMARRGLTYGTRSDDANDGAIENKPTKDVGLLFMAFNVNLAEQFEFTQKLWANNSGFPRVPAGISAPGLDLVIGQGRRDNIECPLEWGAEVSQPALHKVTSPLPQAVTMKGGEYFFMPSLPFLMGLDDAKLIS